MVEKILQLFSVTCSHRHITQPFSASPSAASKNDDWDSVRIGAPPAAWNHYVVCLDCGRKMQYDWERMRIVK
jgi:hypothetical protein